MYSKLCRKQEARSLPDLCFMCVCDVSGSASSLYCFVGEASIPLPIPYKLMLVQGPEYRVRGCVLEGCVVTCGSTRNIQKPRCPVSRDHKHVRVREGRLKNIVQQQPPIGVGMGRLQSRGGISPGSLSLCLSWDSLPGRSVVSTLQSPATRLFVLRRDDLLLITAGGFTGTSH